jgi:hypothetical protein
MNPRAGSYLAAFLTAAAPLAAQWLNYPTPGIPRTPDGKPNLTAPAPRTADGKPDLSGLWRLDEAGMTGDPMAAIKAQPWAKDLANKHRDEFAKDSPALLSAPSARLAPCLHQNPPGECPSNWGAFPRGGGKYSTKVFKFSLGICVFRGYSCFTRHC